MSFYKKQQGVTLIETVLGLVIIFALIALGIFQYQRYERDNEIREVLAQVDQLFQGLAQYYQANCRAYSTDNPNPNALPTTGTLSVTLSINTGANSLVSNGYIAKWSPILNKLVDVTAGEKGYSAQLTGRSSANRLPRSLFTNWVCTNPATPSTCTTVVTTFPTSIGTIYVWQSHIAMKLATDLDPTLYQKRLGATCTSTDAVTSCASAVPGQYMVWESLPSSASPSTNSVLSSSMARLKAFTNMYYTDDMYAASNSTWGSSTNNYLCGM